MECLLTDLRLGRSCPGLSEPASWCAERGGGHWEAMPRAGREGSMQRGRERAATALPEVQQMLLAQFLEVNKPVFDDCLVQSKSSLLSVCAWRGSHVMLSLCV